MQSRRCGVGAGGLAVSVTGFGLGKGGPAHGDRLCVVFSAGTTSRVSARGRLADRRVRRGRRACVFGGRVPGSRRGPAHLSHHQVAPRAQQVVHALVAYLTRCAGGARR